MQGMICIPKKNEEHLHGKNLDIERALREAHNAHSHLDHILKFLNINNEELNYILPRVRRCDRILWYGRGLHQLAYVRGESRFSDHRPVYSIFSAEVESLNRGRNKRNMSYASSRVEVEELLPYSHGYTDLNFF